MPTTITTDVFTLEELEALGDERAVERALEWMRDGWSEDADEHVSSLLTEVMADAFGANTLTWESWDYWRSDIKVSGSLSRSSFSVATEDGPLAGMAWPGGDLVDSFTYRTSTSGSYGRIDNVWLYVTEDGPAWDSPPYDALCDEVTDWLRQVEERLVKVMRDEYEYLTSPEYLREACVDNGYTFTADGKRFG